MTRRNLATLLTAALAVLFLSIGIAGLTFDAPVTPWASPLSPPVLVSPSSWPVSATPNTPGSSGPVASGPVSSISPSLSPTASNQLPYYPWPSPSRAPIPASSTPTRVVVSGLKIDLPVIVPSKTETFPLCNVAEYLASFGTPGGAGITYIYAHARIGMFLPLLNTFLNKGASGLIDKQVIVYTADQVAHYYVIDAVFPHVLNWDKALAAPVGDLILQTSETPYTNGTKMMVRAAPVMTVPDQPAALALTPHPIVCQ